jgi:hypothetical protein
VRDEGGRRLVLGHDGAGRHAERLSREEHRGRRRHDEFAAGDPSEHPVERTGRIQHVAAASAGRQCQLGGDDDARPFFGLHDERGSHAGEQQERVTGGAPAPDDVHGRGQRLHRVDREQPTTLARVGQRELADELAHDHRREPIGEVSPRSHEPALEPLPRPRRDDVDTCDVDERELVPHCHCRPLICPAPAPGGVGRT